MQINYHDMRVHRHIIIIVDYGRRRNASVSASLATCIVFINLRFDTIHVNTASVTELYHYGTVCQKKLFHLLQ